MTNHEYTVSTDMATGSPAARPSSPLRTYGLLCVAGGLIAVAGITWQLLLDPAVPDTQMSYPMSPNTFRAAELVWTLTHVLTLFGALALARTGLAGTGRAARIGRPLMLTGMALLVPAELAFITTAESAADSGLAVAIGSAIGLAATLAGLGFTLTGVGVLRDGRWTGPARFLPLAVGVYELTVVTAVAPMSGTPFLLGIGGWNLLLALLGAALAAGPKIVRP